MQLKNKKSKDKGQHLL